MPEKKRTYESEVDSLPALKIQPRPANPKREERSGSLSSLEGARLPENASGFSRDTIIRLIDQISKKV